MTKRLNLPPKRLLVQIDMRHAASREMIAGVMRHAALHGGFEVQIAGAHPASAPVERFRSWKPDALIADATVHALSPRAFAALSGEAAVFVNTPPHRACRVACASLTTDDRTLAQTAADLFLSKGLTSFAYVGAPEAVSWSDARRRFFCAALKARGFPAEVFSQPAAAWRRQETALARWLASLPRPCGVWAAYDQRAKHVLDACRLAGLAVPEQIQVLGVDNEPFICEQTRPPLSSLVPDFEAGGYAAAQFVAAALAGRREDARLLFPVRGVVERLSTDDVNGRARHVAVAREFIRRNAASGIGVRDVAAAAGISVRLLQKDYAAVTGTTVVETLIATKLARVKELLRKTTSPLPDIARLSGFPSVPYLMTLFRRRCGVTMTAYRGGCGARTDFRSAISAR